MEDADASISEPSGKVVSFKKRKAKSSAVRDRTEAEEINEEVATALRKPVVKKGLLQTMEKSSKPEEQKFDSSRHIMPAKSSEASVIVEKPPERAEKDKDKPRWIVGPSALANNVRVVSYIDYNPSLCKDYKETGYCGFGDSCKFLHDRGDYKSGYQIEQEWQSEQEQKFKLAALGTTEEVGTEPDDNLPWACVICRQDFARPVVTKCNHYFCESCAVSNFVKNPRCAACNEHTQGIFNTAAQLIDVIARRKEKGLKPPNEPVPEPEDAEKSSPAPPPPVDHAPPGLAAKSALRKLKQEENPDDEEYLKEHEQAVLSIKERSTQGWAYSK